jgi:ubiquinone/menaquinone biosynthesis C-methylase UbiE
VKQNADKRSLKEKVVPSSMRKKTQMSLIETDETNQFTFEPFAAHAFYTQVNRLLVQRAIAHLIARQPSSEAQITIVDMACGTGAISRLIAEEMAKHRPLANTCIVGVDPSAEALRLTEKSMQAEYPEVKTKFLQGDVSDLSKVVQNADAAFFCNAIHLVPDKRDAFQHVAEILVPNGIFACNSAFYQGTYVEGTERFYRLWTRRAVGWLKKEHPEVHLSREAKAMAMQWMTPEEYVVALQESGFGEVDVSSNNAIMALDAWRDLGKYWLFIEGALPGVPLALGAAALEHAVYQAGQELNLTEVPRTWLQLISTKR